MFGIIRKSQGEANLVFIPQRQARRLAAIHTAISEATTWKSFCDLMPVDDLWKVTSELRDRHPLPAMTDEFDDRWLPFGYHDGDWPDWPEQLMENWLPSRICAEYGKLDGSLLNDDFLILDLTPHRRNSAGSSARRLPATSRSTAGQKGVRTLGR